MKRTKVIAKVLLQDNDGNLLLIQRSKTDVRRPLQWDIPGGAADESENYISAAARETFEEIGIKVDPKDLDLAYTVTDMTEYGNHCWMFYVARTNSKDVKLSPEHINAQWVDLESAIKMINYPRQKDVLIYLRDNDLLQSDPKQP